MAISEIFAGIKVVLDLLIKQDAQRRDVADLLEKIAKSMELTIEPALKGERISIEHLEEFAVYCTKFEEVVGRQLQGQTRDDLWELMHLSLVDDRAWNLIDFFEFTREPNGAVRESEVHKSFERVTKAIAQLRAYANLLRASRKAI